MCRLFAPFFLAGAALLVACVRPCHGGIPMSTPSTPASRFVEGPGGRLFVDDQGTGGIPVVFIHSSAGSTRHWEGQLAHLRPARRAIAIDVRGHGRSEAPRDGSYAVAAMGADVVAVADELGLERFILVGHSLGAAVAIAAAARIPDRVAGLLLLDPSTDARLMPKEEAEGLLDALRSPAYAPMTEGYWKEQLSGAR